MSMCTYYQMHSWEHVQQVGEHATPKQKVLVDDIFFRFVDLQLVHHQRLGFTHH